MTTDPKPCIGVVDDDPGVRVALRQLLRAGGYEAMTFASAEEFLAHEQRESIDSLIVDVNLPGMSGVALLKSLSNNGSAPSAVLMTARDDPTTLELLKQAAPVRHLHKPFSDSELFDAIEHARRP
jgi:FixJ family two-component response regulator